MKFQMMEENSMIGMVQFKQMFQRPRFPFMMGLDIMNLNRLESDDLYLLLQETRKAERKREGREGRKHVNGENGLIWESLAVVGLIPDEEYIQ